MKTFTRDSAEEVDDVSPEWLKRLQALNSPKVKSGRVNVVKIENGEIAPESKKENKFFSAVMPYIEHYEDRFNALNSVLFTHEFEFATVEDGDSFGVELNKVIQNAKEWILLTSKNARISDDFADRIGKYVLNPGTLHYIDLSKSEDGMFVVNAAEEQTGYAALFSKNAISLREFGFDRVAHTKSFADIVAMWQSNKIVELSSVIENPPVAKHDFHGVRYAIWGTGLAGSVAVDMITRGGGTIAFAVDKDKARQGCDFYGTMIQAPSALKGRDNEYDVLIVANYTRFPEIRNEAEAMGIDKRKIQYINDLA